MPVEGVDYHCVRYKAGSVIPGHYARSGGTKKDMISVMSRPPFAERVEGNDVQPPRVMYVATWAAIPGPKPKKEWGEVCL